MKTLLLAFLCSFSAAAADTNETINAWLAAQSKLKTWTADLTQTRTIKALKKPSENKGRLIFEAPNFFRWELGNPPQTIAIRNTNELLVAYPRLKRIERYPLAGSGNEQWRDALALMDAGFPANRAELESRFKLTSISNTNDLIRIAMEPRSSMAKKFMSEVQVYLRTNDFSMAANQLQFADGTILRNDFTNSVANPAIPTNAFTLDQSGMEIVEPLKK